MIAGSQITIDGDTAEGKTMCHNPMVMEAEQLMFCGLWYRDRFVRTADGWRIKERVEELCYFHNAPEGMTPPGA
jgi:SnoaL-like domain